eukprot:UN03383
MTLDECSLKLQTEIKRRTDLKRETFYITHRFERSTT